MGQPGRHAVARARRAWSAHGADASLRLVERDGGHAQTLADWLAAIDALRVSA